MATVCCGTRESGEQPGVSGSALSAHCSGTPVISTQHKFRSTGRSVIIDTCPADPNGAPVFAVRDALTGAAADLEALRKEDALVFHDVKGTIDGTTAAMLDAAPGKKFDAHVWLRVDLSDDPTKDEEAANNAVASAASAKREARIREAASAFVARFAATSDREIVTNVAAAVEYGVPMVRVRATRDALHELGKHPTVWRVMLDSDDVKTQSPDDYYCTTGTSALDYIGFDGSGQTVAILEWGMADSYLNLPNAVTDPNGCLPKPQQGYGSVRKKCHCPGGTYDPVGHPRLMAGIVAGSSLPFGGIADQATLIFANHAGCTTNGPDEFSSALNWATSNGARIISRSETWGVPWESLDDGMQTSRDFLVDYKTSSYPWPFVAESAGNDATYAVGNHLRNGVVVGGAFETNGCNRTGVWMDSTSWQNPNGTGGFEVPNLVAISANVDTVGALQTQTEVTGGSSAATAQVAATVASLHEANTSLQSWPEVVVPGLLVSANEDVDGTQLNLHDSWDDKDGAGLLNGIQAYLALSSSAKLNGGNSPAARGHDYGTIYESTTPTYTTYSEIWNVTVAAGRAVRVAGLLQSRPTCPANPGCNEQTDGGPVGGCFATNICSANPYVIYSLQLYEGTTLRAAANNTSTSYQFVRYVNTSGVSKTYQIKIIPLNYNGLAGTTWGVAWSEE